MDGIGSSDYVPPSRGTHESSRPGSDYTSAVLSHRSERKGDVHGLVRPFYNNLEMMDYIIVA